MRQVGRRGKARRAVAPAITAVSVLVLAGCASSVAAPGPVGTVVALQVAAPLHEPVWSDNGQTLLALTEDDQHIAKVVTSGTAVQSTLSAPLADVGRNLTTSPTRADVVYLPQPRLGRVAVVAIGDLHQVDILQVGPQPSYLDKDSGTKGLLAVSADGATVTGVDLRDGTVVTSQSVGRDPDTEVDGSKRGRRIEFHLADSRSVAFYKGDPGAVQKLGELPISAEKSTSDLVKSSRLYIAERGTNRLLAVDQTRSLGGLEMVGTATLDAPVKYLGVDETRIYAATDDKLVVFKTNSFEGYRNGVIPPLQSIDLRAALPDGPLKTAPLSGLALGPNQIFLTLQGQPYVLSVTKPSS